MTTIESAPVTGRGRSAATPDRVPVPTRQRRPGLAALAIVLILGGAALSGYLAITSGNKQSVVVLNRDVANGQLITAADLTTQSISAPGVAVIPADQLSQVASRGYRANGKFPRGTILNQGMLLGFHIPGASYVSAAVLIQEGQYPPETVSPGSAVKVIYTPGQDNTRTAGGAPTQAIAGLAPGATLVEVAYVDHSQRASGGGNAIFTLIVPNDDPASNGRRLSNLALANAAHSLTIVKLPIDTRPTTGEGQS
jgi:hypothetical protein